MATAKIIAETIKKVIDFVFIIIKFLRVKLLFVNRYFKKCAKMAKYVHEMTDETENDRINM